MEVSGQLHAPAALHQVKSPLYPLDRRQGGLPVADAAVKRKILSSHRELKPETPDRPARSLVATPNELSQKHITVRENLGCIFFQISEESFPVVASIFTRHACQSIYIKLEPDHHPTLLSAQRSKDRPPHVWSLSSEVYFSMKYGDANIVNIMEHWTIT
jgi:hypothetical protein